MLTSSGFVLLPRLLKLVDRFRSGRDLELRADPTIPLSPRPVDDLTGLFSGCGSHFFSLELSRVPVGELGELGDGGVFD